METHAVNSPSLEIPVPHSFGVAVAATLTTVFIAAFCLLAITNLSRFEKTPNGALFSSVAWLILVAVVIVGLAREHGVRSLIVRFLGYFSQRQRVWVDSEPGDEPSFACGFWMLGQRFEYFRVSMGRIRKLNWNSGQATSMSGRDCGDWSVALWYAAHSGKRRKVSALLTRDIDLQIIGLTGPRAGAESLGLQIVALLKQSGLSLEPSAADNEYTVGTNGD